MVPDTRQDLQLNGGNLPVATMSDLVEAGTIIGQSGMLGARNPAEGFVIAATCHQKKISLLDFAETYHVINGKPAMRADAMLARFVELGGEFVVVERTAERAEIRVNFKKACAEFSLSWDEAQDEPFVRDKNGGLKDNYATARSRMQMLWARVVSDAVRTVCPLANRGSYTPEEVSDFSDVVDVAASQVSTDDFSTCPIPGQMHGVRWDEMSTEHLTLALELESAVLRAGHRAAIRQVLAAKEND